jgi:hypothetical protein
LRRRALHPAVPSQADDGGSVSPRHQEATGGGQEGSSARAMG